MIILSILCNVFFNSILSLNPIITRGNRFFDTKTGDEFFIKGVAYQPRAGGLYDPLSLPKDCMRDAKVLKDMGVNTIRVYETYSSNDHSQCAQIFEKYGIYLILDLPNYNVSINRATPSYDIQLFDHFKKTIDSFSPFSNTLAFIVGNEVANDKKTTQSAAFVKAALRDMKTYIRKTGRFIPIGYANNDDPDIRENLQNYFNCGNTTETVDFFGVNIYEWCGDTTFEKSGYKERTKEFSNYGIPVVLTEYGCNTIKPRKFGDIDALYGNQMRDVFSGGIAYEYTAEENDYGLVEIKKGSQDVKILDDGKALKKQLSKFINLKPKYNLKSYNIKSKQQICPKISGKWEASTKLPPTPNESVCNCVYSTLQCRMDSVTGKDKEVGKVLGDICGKDPQACKDIAADSKKALYGPYSFCNLATKASVVFDHVYKKSSKCEFNGLAKLNKKSKNMKCDKMAYTQGKLWTRSKISTNNKSYNLTELEASETTEDHTKESDKSKDNSKKAYQSKKDDVSSSFEKLTYINSLGLLIVVWLSY